MSRINRKNQKGDWLFRIFALICIVVSFYIITQTKPDRRVFGTTSSTETNSSVEDTSLKTGNSVVEPATGEAVVYYFRSDDLLSSHFEKHGKEMGFSDKKAYEAAASAVITNPDALHKIEAEDGDDVYYLEETNEFVVLSTDGYIRTYFCPDSGKKYFDKQ